MTRHCEQTLVGAVQELKKLFEFQGQRQPLVLDDAYTRGYVHLLWQSLQKRRSTASGHFFCGTVAAIKKFRKQVVEKWPILPHGVMTCPRVTNFKVNVRGQNNSLEPKGCQLIYQPHVYAILHLAAM